MIVREINLKYKIRKLTKKETNLGILNTTIDSPKIIAKVTYTLIQNEPREHFFVFFLDRRNSILNYRLISIGTVSESIVHCREVFQAAIMTGASQIIIAHNHPSGQLDPSSQDLSLTKRIKQAGEILGIALLDHVIVDCNTPDHFYSLKESGAF